MNDIAASLRDGLSAEAVVDSGAAMRILYARDCWPELLIRTRAGEHALHPPDLVARPACVEDVRQIVRFCAQRNLPIVAWGAGSGVAGASVPVRGGVVLDLKALRSLDLSMAPHGIARIGAGWVGARLEQELQRKGYTLGHFPSSIGCSTLGGWLATRSAGQLSSRYGKIEDMVLGLRWVDGQGRLRTSGFGSGDDHPLLVGSEGTLGVITDAWMKVEARPASPHARGFLADNVEQGLAAMRTLLQRGLRPAVLRLYDGFDTFISSARKAADPPRPDAGLHTRPLEEAIAKWAAPGAHRSLGQERLRRAALGLLGRSLGAPLLLNRASARAFQGCLLVVGVEEADEAHAALLAEEVFGHLGHSLQDLGEGPGRHWYAHRYDVSYKQSAVYDAGLFVDTMEVAASWTALPRLYQMVRDALSEHVFVMAHFSHAYPTGCSIYFTFAGFGSDVETCLQRYHAAWSAALHAAAASGGSVTHHHGVGLLKAPWLHADHGDARSAFEALRVTADPSGIMNPGKLWDVPAHSGERP